MRMSGDSLCRGRVATCVLVLEVDWEQGLVVRLERWLNPDHFSNTSV